MKLKFFVVVFSLLISLSLKADHDEKINNKLSKLYEKGKYEKCLKKAHSYNKKYPKSIVPEYYMSRINYQFFTSREQQSIESFINLRNAIRYSQRLPDSSFFIWKDSLQVSLRNFIISNADSSYISNNYLKKAISFYTKTYSDTIDAYYVFFPQEKQIIVRVTPSGNTKLDSLRNKLISFAEKQQGIRYKYAGEKPETGFDCSGFTKYVYSSIGVELPHNAHKQSQLRADKLSLEQAREGDLIFFGYTNDSSYHTQHAGIIYSIRNNKIKVIHCVSNGVSIDGENSSWSHYWKDRVLFVKSMEAIFDEEKDK